MTFHLESHTTIDVKPEMNWKGINMINVALPMCAQTEKMTFSCIDDITLTKHTRRWTYSALRYFFYMYSVNLGDALTTTAMRPIFSCPEALCIYLSICISNYNL